MNHKWKNNECTTCGCERNKTYNNYFYSRSGMNFAFRPDCIDWEVENNKTID